MKAKAQVQIKASKEKVWRVITDFDGCVVRISAIDKIEVLNRPSDTLIGFKWRETRTMFGKTATETMTITEAVDNQYYATRAENHGMIYESRLSLMQSGEITFLTMQFKGKGTTFFSKLLSKLMSSVFSRATRKALQQDLEEIKVACEQS